MLARLRKELCAVQDRLERARDTWISAAEAETNFTIQAKSLEEIRCCHAEMTEIWENIRDLEARWRHL